MVVPSIPFGRGPGALHQCLFGSAASYLIYADVRIHIPMTHRNDRLRDQFVVQLSGSKHWVLCSHDSPPEGLTLSTEMFVGKTGTLSQADIAALRDLRRRSSISALSDPAAGGEGGGDGGGDGSDQSAPPWTGYEESVYKDVSYERGELTCFNVVASAGDRLYIPAGMLYRASAVGDQISAHLSISLHRLGVTWGDLIVASMGTVRHDLQAAAAAAAPAEEEEEEEEGGGGGGGSGGRGGSGGGGGGGESGEAGVTRHITQSALQDLLDGIPPANGLRHDMMNHVGLVAGELPGSPTWTVRFKIPLDARHSFHSAAHAVFDSLGYKTDRDDLCVRACRVPVPVTLAAVMNACVTEWGEKRKQERQEKRRKTILID